MRLWVQAFGDFLAVAPFRIFLESLTRQGSRVFGLPNVFRLGR